MWIVSVVSLVLGVFASRRIIAESDAHRLFEADRWTEPICADCGAPLRLTTLHCTLHRHPQRRSNIAITVATPVLIGAMALVVPSLWVWPAYGVFAAASVLLFVTDVDTQLIPNRILVRALAVGFPMLVVGWLIDRDSGSLITAAAAAFAYFAAMYLLALIARGGLGYGDVKLAFLIGGFCGFLGWSYVVIAGIGAFLIGGLVAIVLLVTRVRGRKDAIAFGPFMIVAGIVAVIWGSAITDWYLG
jgi:leader peptidase (prepilin peptidase)/N-methyltransferase